jgi:hypothetical protein
MIGTEASLLVWAIVGHRERIAQSVGALTSGSPTDRRGEARDPRATISETARDEAG